MAQAESKSTRSNYLSITKNVFPTWRDQLGSAAAIAEIENLLCHPDTRSAKWRVDDTSGEEIPDTRSVLNSWQTVGSLRLIPDADGGADDVDVVYKDLTETYIDAYWPDGHWEYGIRRDDVERWERQRLYFPLTAVSPPAPGEAPTPLEKHKRYSTDDALVAEAIKGIKNKTFPNAQKAAEALAPRAEGPATKSSKVDRLRHKIKEALSAP